MHAFALQFISSRWYCATQQAEHSAQLQVLELLARIKRQDAGIEEMPPVSLPSLEGGGTDGEGATAAGRQDDSSEDGFLDLNATDEGFLDGDLEDDFDDEDFEYEVEEDEDDDEDRTDEVVDAYLSGGSLEPAPKDHDCGHDDISTQSQPCGAGKPESGFDTFDEPQIAWAGAGGSSGRAGGKKKRKYRSKTR